MIRVDRIVSCAANEKTLQSKHLGMSYPPLDKQHVAQHLGHTASKVLLKTVKKRKASRHQQSVKPPKDSDYIL